MRAVINTLESTTLEEIVERSQVLEFFQALDRIFQLEYGRVLLALSSSHQLEDMLERELPFLANYTEELPDTRDPGNKLGENKKGPKNYILQTLLIFQRGAVYDSNPFEEQQNF